MTNTAQVLGIRIHSMPVSKLVEQIIRTIDEGKRIIVAYVNVHAMNIAYEQPDFAHFLNSEANYVFCDGFGVKLGALLLGEKIAYRYTPPDWIDELCAACAQRGYTLYFLGAAGDVAERAAKHQMKNHPGLRVVGWHHGYFNKTYDHPDNQAVIDDINRCKPNILVVGFGMPMQERWLSENWDRLEAHVAFPVGAMFDYVVGEVYRAPRWITDNGLEWLARLVIEPRRLWKRYMIGLPVFFYRVIRQRLGLDGRFQHQKA